LCHGLLLMRFLGLNTSTECKTTDFNIRLTKNQPKERRRLTPLHDVKADAETGQHTYTQVNERSYMNPSYQHPSELLYFPLPAHFPAFCS
jgi:hypothetical protein